MANKSIQLQDGNDNAYPTKADIVPFTVTPVSGVTIGRQNCWYEPDTKRVVINAYCTASNFTGNNWATVPSQYIPTSDKIINIALRFTSEEFMRAYVGFGRITTSGYVMQTVTGTSQAVCQFWGEYYLA